MPDRLPGSLDHGPAGPLGDEGFVQAARLGDDEAQADLAARRNIAILELDPIEGFVDQRDMGKGVGGEGPARCRTLAVGEFIGVVAAGAQICACS